MRTGKRSRRINPFARAALNSLLSMAICALLVLLGAKIIMGGTISIQSKNILSYVIIGIAALVGSFLTAKQTEKAKLPFAMATAVLFFLALSIGNGVLQRGSFQRFIPTASIVLGAGLLSGLLGARQKKHKYG